MTKLHMRSALAGLGLLLSATSVQAEAGDGKVFSGLNLSLDAGAARVQPSAQRESRIGSRAVDVGFRTSLSLFRQLVLGMGMDILDFDDKAPTSELVVDCTTYGGRVTSCADTPRSEKSDVQTVVLKYEVGYQPQFRVRDDFARFSPALIFGYMHTVRDIERKVACTDCPDGEKLPLSVSSPYLAGSAEIAFPWAIGFALSVRSQWYFLADLAHTTTAGLGCYFE